MNLKLVPSAKPTGKQAVIDRIKQHPKLDGTLQCPPCGSRTVVKLESGVRYIDGKRKPGTIVERDICAHCWQRGVMIRLRWFLPKQV